jgi:hypothetical protein
MSQEWLKKLAEISNDPNLMKRAQQLEQRAAAAPARRQSAATGRRRSLFGAAFGSFFRFLLIFGLVEAALMFLIADREGLGAESWGYIFHYSVWYLLTQPILPPDAYEFLRDAAGITSADLAALYERLNEYLQQQQDVLVFAVPAGAAAALTVFFLPGINAGRRRSPIRLLVYIANLAVIPLYPAWGAGVAILWLAALVFSFVHRVDRSQRPESRPAAAAQPQKAAHPVVAAQPQTPSRPAATAAAASSAATSVIARGARQTTGLRRDPTVLRRGSSNASWVRER